MILKDGSSEQFNAKKIASGRHIYFLTFTSLRGSQICYVSYLEGFVQNYMQENVKRHTVEVIGLKKVSLWVIAKVNWLYEDLEL